MIFMNEKISVEEQYFSQFGEDKWIVNNLPYPLNGVFVDVGASDGIYGNNTYFFEKIGWKGLCIDADPCHHTSLLMARVLLRTIMEHMLSLRSILIQH